MALATVDADGLPDARMVLLKDVDARGFVFYTNTQSAKGRELAANPKAALLFHWKSLRRQVRVRGPIEPVTPAEADAYFASRARASQIGAWASDQSRSDARPLRAGEARRRVRPEVRPRQGSPPAALVGLSPDAALHRVLARPAVPPARAAEFHPRGPDGGWTRGAAVSLKPPDCPISDSRTARGFGAHESYKETAHAGLDAELAADGRPHPRPRRRLARRPRGRHPLDRGPDRAHRPTPPSTSGPAAVQRAAGAWASSPATGSAPWPGTPAGTWRPGTRSWASARSATPSTRGCSPTSSATSSTTPKTGSSSPT